MDPTSLFLHRLLVLFLEGIWDADNMLALVVLEELQSGAPVPQISISLLR